MLDANNLLEYYLALLSVQMAVLGFVIAGIVALLQIINSAKPRRDTRLLISLPVLFSYIAFLTVVLLGLGAASWAIGFNKPNWVDFFARPGVGAVLLAACLAGLFWFVYLTYKSRRLLEAEHYLQEYIRRVPAQRVRDYLFRIYSSKPQPFEPDPDETDKTKQAKQAALYKQRKQQIMAWERRYRRHKNLPDPFQPIREYIKDNAFKYYDYGTAMGLGFFEQLYDKAFMAVTKNPQSEEYYFLARYTAENTQELFSIFTKTLSEKRRADIIRFARARGRQFITNTYSEGLLTTVRALEQMAESADNDQDVVLCIESIQQLTDTYLQKHANDDWQTVAATFEQICLSVARLAEQYYGRRENQLSTLSVNNQITGESRTVTGMLAGFFTSRQQLADRYADTYPTQYFEAIQTVLEALLWRYAELAQSGRAARVQNRQYQELIKKLHTIYLEFGHDAVQQGKPELLALSLANLGDVLGMAAQLELRHEQESLVAMLVELTIRGAEVFGETAAGPGERTAVDYVTELLAKYSDTELTGAAFTNVVKLPGIDLRLKAVRPVAARLRAAA